MDPSWHIDLKATANRGFCCSPFLPKQLMGPNVVVRARNRMECAGLCRDRSPSWRDKFLASATEPDNVLALGSNRLVGAGECVNYTEGKIEQEDVMSTSTHLPPQEALAFFITYRSCWPS